MSDDQKYASGILAGGVLLSVIIVTNGGPRAGSEGLDFLTTFASWQK
jgi:hypothetical protein